MTIRLQHPVARIIHLHYKSHVDTNPILLTHFPVLCFLSLATDYLNRCLSIFTQLTGNRSESDLRCKHLHLLIPAYSLRLVDIRTNTYSILRWFLRSRTFIAWTQRTHLIIQISFPIIVKKNYPQIKSTEINTGGRVGVSLSRLYNTYLHNVNEKIIMWKHGKSNSFKFLKW